VPHNALFGLEFKISVVIVAVHSLSTVVQALMRAGTEDEFYGGPRNTGFDCRAYRNL
jgi:hypothetical protein